jgi:hypothetical protein
LKPLLAEFYFQKSEKDIPMPAIYGNEKSGMNYGKCVLYMEEN